MDFGPWSPSHTILVFFIAAGFVGQLAIYFYRTAQNDKKSERLEERMDKRFAETINTNNERFKRLEEQMDKRFAEIINTMNQHLSDVRGEIRDVRIELSKLNQNHIDHLNQHHVPLVPRSEDPDPIGN